MRVFHCKSCGAPIVFIGTGNRTSIPCNAQPLPYWQIKGGSKKIVTPNGVVLSAELEGIPGTETGMGYITHFATCPDAEKFRKGRRTE